MAPNSPISDNPVDFRAPPPSPIASGRKSSFTNDAVLTEFLEHSLRVPDLILPDNIFPKQKFIESPPVIDFRALLLADYDAVSKMMESVASIGCFQLTNHGISSELVRSVQTKATGIFRVPPETRVKVTRSPEKPYGFDEVHGEEIDSELSEEFVWSMDEGLKSEMEGILPLGYPNFSKQMEALWLKMEKLAEKTLVVFLNNPPRKPSKDGNVNDETLMERREASSVCCVFKHNIPNDVMNSHDGIQCLKYDVMRMLIRRTDHSHSLCLHLCEDSSEFHVYSKRGWVSFCPDKHSFVITIGDQIQTWSGGQYKHVIGRPIYKGNNEDCISMAFLYCPEPTLVVNSKSKTTRENTVSFTQQLILAILLTFVFQFLVYVYTQFW